MAAAIKIAGRRLRIVPEGRLTIAQRFNAVSTLGAAAMKGLVPKGRLRSLDVPCKVSRPCRDSGRGRPVLNFTTDDADFADEGRGS